MTQNSLLYGWTMLDIDNKKYLVRIPGRPTLKSILLYSNELNEDCLGIPKCFENYDSCFYLIKSPILQLYILDKKLSELKKHEDYIILNEKNPQIEMKLSHWKIVEYDENKFEFVKKCWIFKRFDDYKFFNRQQKLPL